MGLDSSVFVHERALCDSHKVGARTRIWDFAHVLEGAELGEDCNICAYVFIEGDVVIGDRVVLKPGVQVCDKVRIGDDVFIGPNATFTNVVNPRVAFKKYHDEWLPTHVERGATIGANATILCDLTIAEHAFVGAGAVVIKDVPRHALVVGNPAKQVGWMCVCGERLNDALECRCGRRYRLVSDREGLAPDGSRG